MSRKKAITITVRADKIVWLILGPILLSVPAVMLWQLPKCQTRIDAIPSIVLAAVFITLFIFISGSKIEISKNRICYFRPFIGRKCIAWKDIEKVKSGFELQSTTYYLDLYGVGDTRIRMNIKPFDRGRLAMVAACLIKRSKRAIIDEKTKKMAEGVPPSFTGDLAKYLRYRL